MNKFLYAVWITSQILTGYNLVLPLVLYLLYRTRKRRLARGEDKIKEYDYAIIVTAYEQTEYVPAAVNSILNLDYHNYIIYVVADKCDVSQLHFDDNRVVVLRPPQALSSNTRSHFYAINRFIRKHDLMVIVDSDNLVDSQLLNELNRYFDKGFSAVQGVRKAKNLDTTYACLDAARDIYYHFYDGEVLFNIGSSATLAGSGMAFKVALYKECLETLDVSGAGFDKVLQMEIVKRGHRIAFNERAIVYDEKTSASQQLVKQRARWINTWFRYSWFGVSLLEMGIKRFNLNQFLFGLVLLRPPLFMFLLLSVFFLSANFWVSAAGVLLWLLSFAIFISGFAVALAHARPDRRVIKSLINIPRFVFFQVVSLLLAGRANKISVATHHYNNTTIDQVQQ